MNGRQEHNLIIENKIKNMLNGSCDYIKEYSYSFQQKTATTKRAYIRYIMDFATFLGEKPLDEVRPVDIDRYMEHIKYRDVNGETKENKASIRATKLFAISNFYKFMVKNKYMSENPCKETEVPKDRVCNEVVAMTPDEIRTIKKNIIYGCGTDRQNRQRQTWKNRDLAIITLGCTTGMRVTEITEINLADINWDENKLISTGKGNKTRYIYIGESTKECLLDWIKDREELLKGFPHTDALFISNRRKRISSRAIGDLLDNYTKNIEKHITPHKMRSSCATNLFEKTGNIFLVQQQLGHENVETTKRYTKVSDASRRNAANILDAIF